MSDFNPDMPNVISIFTKEWKRFWEGRPLEKNLTEKDVFVLWSFLKLEENNIHVEPGEEFKVTKINAELFGGPEFEDQQEFWECLVKLCDAGFIELNKQALN